MSLIKQVRTFFESQTGVVTPKDLARQFLEVSAFEIADICTELAKEGFLKIQYKVVKPDGVAYEQEFNDPRDIPDNYDQTSNVVPVFYKV